MRASQELRWKQSIKDNEERRRRYDEAGKRIEEEQRAKAQGALERRRMERARIDELMRNPAQQPAQPKKVILRKGAGSVLRAPSTPKAQAAAPAPTPAADGAAGAAGQARPDLERQRREWSEGLKQYIARQREAVKAAGGKVDDQADALSWHELKLAAEAGFEELLRHQEAAAAAEQQQAGPANWRRPGMSRPKGGGQPACSAAAAGAAAGGAAALEGMLQAGPSPPMSPAYPATQGSPPSSTSPTSKWALRMKQVLDKAMHNTDTGEGPTLSGPAAPGGNALSTAVHQEGPGQKDQQQKDQAHLIAAEQLEASAGAQQQQQQVVAAEDPGPSAGDRGDAATLQPVQQLQELPSCTDLPPVEPGGMSPRPSAAAGPSTQQLSASAQQASAALRESMEKLHRATELVRSTVKLPLNIAAHTHADADAANGYTASPRVRSSIQQGLQQQHAAAAAAGLASGSSGTAPAAGDSNDIGSSSAGICWNEAAARPGRCSRSTVGDSAASLEPCGAVDNDSTACKALAEQSHDAGVGMHSGAAAGTAAHSAAISSGVQLKEQVQQQEEEEAAGALQLEEQHSVQQQQQQTAADLADEQSVQTAQQARGHAQPKEQQQQQCHSQPPVEGPTLDSLLAEVQQLAVLRKALKAEFAAMGHGNIVAAMGTLGLTQDQVPAAVLPPAQQQQQQQHQQQQQQQHKQVLELQSNQPAVEQLRHHQQPLPGCHTAARPPDMLAKQQEVELPIPGSNVQDDDSRWLAGCSDVQQAVESPVEELARQLAEPEVGNVSEAGASSSRALSAAQAAVPALAQKQRQQQQRPVPMEQEQEGQQERAQVKQQTVHTQQQQPQQQQQSQQQQPSRSLAVAAVAAALHDGASTLSSGTFTNDETTASESAAASPPHYTTEEDLAGSIGDIACDAAGQKAGNMPATLQAVMQGIAAAPMDLSFSFGLGAQRQQGLSQPASPQPLTQCGGGSYTSQLQHDANASGASHTGEQQAYLQIEQQRVQQQQQQQQLLALQSLPQQQQQPFGSFVGGPQGLVGLQAAAQPFAAVVPPLLNWDMYPRGPVPAGFAAADAAGSAGAAAAAATSMLQPLMVPEVSCLTPQAGVTAAAVAAQMAAAQIAAAAAADTCSAASSRCTSPSQKHPVVSKWVSDSPTSTCSRRPSPLPSPGSGAVPNNSAAPAPGKRGYSSPSSSAVSGHSGSSSSSYLVKLARQVSSGTGTAQPAAAAGPAAERPLLNQGSYLAAALQARQRVEREQAERQRLEAAVAAARHAAAKKLLEEKLEAQRAAAAKPSVQIAPVAIGSYAQPVCPGDAAPAASRAAVQNSQACQLVEYRRATEGVSQQQPQQPQQQQQQWSLQQPKSRPRVTTPPAVGSSGAAGGVAGQKARGATSGPSTPLSSRSTQPSPPASSQGNSPSPTRRVRVTDRLQAAAPPAPTPAALATPPAAAAKPPGQMQQPAAPRGPRGTVSGAGSGMTSPCQPASRIPSAPGTPHGQATQGYSATPPARTAAAGSYAYCAAAGAAGATDVGVDGLGESCDSDFDYLERELDYVGAVAHGAAARAVPNSGWGQQAAAAHGSRSTPLVVPLQSAIAAAAAASSAAPQPGNQQGMWAAVQAAAAAAAKRNTAAGTAPAAMEQAKYHAAAGSDTKPVTARPPVLHIPAAAAESVSCTPASAAPRSASAAGVAQNSQPLPRAPLPSAGRQAAAAGVSSAAEPGRAAGARVVASPARTPPVSQPSLTPTTGYSRQSKLSPIAASAAPAAAALVDKAAHRLSMEEAELLASLQLLDTRMHAKAMQQVPTNSSTPSSPPAAAAPRLAAPAAVPTAKASDATRAGVKVGAGRKGLSAASAAPAGVTKAAAAAAAAAGLGSAATVAAGGMPRDQQLTAQQQQRLQTSLEALDVRLAAIITNNSSSNINPPNMPASSGGKPSAAAAAAPGRAAGHVGSKAAAAVNKAPTPTPNKAKEQRENRLAAARAPAATGLGAAAAAKQPPPPAAASPSGTGLGAVGVAGAAAGWFGQWPPACFVPQMGHHSHAPGFYPAAAAYGPPQVAWADISAAQLQHGMGPHAAAAMAAAAPAHMRAAHDLMPAAYGQMPAGAYCPPHFSQQHAAQQQQMYWAAMQAQQYQWQHQQQAGMGMFPCTAGSMVGYSRPGSGAGQLQPPHSAPTGSQYLPGSPLLPTLHYQQTVMRNRTSASGDRGDDSSRRSSGAGDSGLSPVGRGTHVLGGQQQQQHPRSADVWPHRGVERPVKGVGPVGGGSKGVEQGDTGSIRVYKAGLLL